MTTATYEENLYTEVKSFGTIYPKKGGNPIYPYSHQVQAMQKLNSIDKNKHYSTLVVLPTGGGKTYTAAVWLLKHAINKGIKVLWIAHRDMLLDQAVEAFQKYAYGENLSSIDSFKYRVISGSSKHDNTSDIEADDDLLIASKDSIGRNLDRLDAWLEDEPELYLVVDEAHHSIAKTYRKVIDYLKGKIANIKIIGLTATPFRTANQEKGLLGKIYTGGIAYQIGLKDLINKRILSKPFFEFYETKQNFGSYLGKNAMESIQNFDALPDNIAKEMLDNAPRNKLIVDTYKDNQKRYGQTIVFAVNVIHAIQLASQFNDAGIKAEFVVSNLKKRIVGVDTSREHMEKAVEDYRNGRIQVLVNVNKLTEGVDLPKTQTVFLARPTVSTTLMTQMVGRALRGVDAGGTENAYIVSFIDNWNQYIAWVNPETLFVGNNEFIDSKKDKAKRDYQLIAIAKIEEFARMADKAVNTDALKRIPFIKRIPIGMYAFTYLEPGSAVDSSYQVMVYDSTAEAYNKLMQELPDLFKSFNATEEEYLDEKTLAEMEQQCRDIFFVGDMVPAYQAEDVINILKYYAQYETAPAFYTFDDIARDKLDIGRIAQYIHDQDFRRTEQTTYVDSLWAQGDNNLKALFFGRKAYFLTQLEFEIEKVEYKGIFEKEDNVKPGIKYYEDLPLAEIGKIDPDFEKRLRDKAFGKAKNAKGEYTCACCGLTSKSRVPFQVDHIVALNNGGKTRLENLQILCRKCNGKKSDK